MNKRNNSNNVLRPSIAKYAGGRDHRGPDFAKRRVTMNKLGTFVGKVIALCLFITGMLLLVYMMTEAGEVELAWLRETRPQRAWFIESGILSTVLMCGGMLYYFVHILDE